MRFIACLFIFCSLLSYGQKKDDNQFEKFAHKQDSLFVKAYDKKDTNGYKKLLKEFLAKYNALSADDKKTNIGYLNGAYYNFCCTYSILNKKSMALEYFKKSIQAGYFNYAHMQEDSDLNNIRNENEFKVIIQPLKNNYDYLFVLKNAAKYNTADNRELPAFTYQSSNDPNLVALRRAFNLDSIVGTGNVESKMINLLHWIHNIVPHDGNHENPAVKNAMSMIMLCKKQKRGLNCRGLSTVLNECYLSLGFKSRFVTCMPKDSLGIDEDCHVIVIVFDTTMKKWVWVDPTNDAYVMNENGEMLSIEEVRTRIVEGKPLILNPDANWNHKESVVKEHYLYQYMTKNLYMMQCPVNSEYNTETSENGKTYTYITLLPLEYYQQSPDKKENLNKEKQTRQIIYNTNNSSKFWAPPS
ncbi:MAG TPA: transglutaminase domain-containing protein [Bacteroidia bacterium]|jgi:hypothetical protein|nr:transglutaminase domain-containing protein [Bacteroidia bacterium]